MRRCWGMATLLLAYGLRVRQLGLKDFWWDEAHSWGLATLPLLRGVAEGLAQHNHFDPLYLIVLHFWSQLSGQTEFALRYLSILLGVLTVAYLARTAWRGFGRQVAGVALALGATAPVWVFFSQEVRQYALLPLVMLMMLDGALELTRQDNTWAWVRLSAAEALGLYAHSFVLFGVLGIQVIIGLLWLRRRIQPKRWLVSQIAVLILALPMLPSNLTRVTGPLSESTLGPARLMNALWHFWMGVQWEEAELPGMPLRYLSGLVLVVFAIGLASTLQRADGRRNAADVFWLIASATVAALLFWQINSKVHPRYLLILSGPLYILVAWVAVALWERHAWGRVLAIGLGGAWLAVAAVGLQGFYLSTYPGYQHDETRAVTTYLRETLGPEDGIISIDPRDNTLIYYDVGPAPVFFAGIAEGIHAPEDLVAFIGGRQRIAVVKFHVALAETQQVAAFYLERYGRYLSSQSFAGYEVRLYQMDENAIPDPVQLSPLPLTNFGPAQIVRADWASGDAPTVALQWDITDQPALLSALIRLVDPETGWELVRVARTLASSVDGTQYFVLPVPPGTPPIPFDVQVSLIRESTESPLDLQDTSGLPRGQWATLGQVTPQPCSDDPYNARERLGLQPVADGPVSAYAVDWPSAMPGGNVGLTLEWREPLVAPWPVIALAQEGQVIAQDDDPPLQGRALAEVLPYIDHRTLAVTAEAVPGAPAEIIVRQDDQEVMLGRLPIIGFERIYERPIVPHLLNVRFGEDYLLVGYDLSARGAPEGAAWLLTLYWQALTDGEPGRDFTVFTHILGADGQLVGQHDGIPAYGTRLTTGWLAGEYITDEHPMAFSELYTGPVTFQVGLYDAVTGERVLTSDGADAALLPETLTVVSEN